MIELSVSYPDGPGDVQGLADWLKGLPKADVSKLIVLGKTEGPATLNDYSRDLAQAAAEQAIGAADAGLLARSIRLFSTGCEGIASPVTIGMAEIGGTPAQNGAQGLVVGMARSNPLPAFPRGGLDHIDAAADAVSRAMKDAGLTPDQVALVLIKSPILIPGQVPPDAGPGARHAGSTGSSRGAAALGVAVALGEVDRGKLSADPVGRDHVFASRAMAFSGIEVDRLEAVVFGERTGGDPRWSILTMPIADFLDAESVNRLKAVEGATPEIVFFKAGIAANGRIRGRRTTALTSDLTPDKQLRAAASGFVAAHFGATVAFISGGAEHQGLPGGCLGATLYRRS